MNVFIGKTRIGSQSILYNFYEPYSDYKKSAFPTQVTKISKYSSKDRLRPIRFDTKTADKPR